MKSIKKLLLALLITSTVCIAQEKKNEIKINKTMSLKKINLAEEFSSIGDMKLKTLTTVNDHSVNIIHLKGDYKMHRHLNGEKIFMVIEGTLFIELKDGTRKEIKKGEIVFIPKGFNHKPSAPKGASLLFFEN